MWQGASPAAHAGQTQTPDKNTVLLGPELMFWYPSCQIQSSGLLSDDWPAPRGAGGGGVVLHACLELSGHQPPRPGGWVQLLSFPLSAHIGTGRESGLARPVLGPVARWEEVSLLPRTAPVPSDQCGC